MRRTGAGPGRGQILFIDATHEFEAGKNQNHLCDEDVQRIAAAYRRYADIERYARVVDLEEIRANDHNLNISRYVDTSEPAEPIDIAAAMARLRELEKARDEAAHKMDALLAELGYTR